MIAGLAAKCALPYWAGVAVLLVVGYLYGRALLVGTARRWSGLPERWFLCTTLGVGAVVLGLFALGVSKQLTAPAVVGVGGLFAALALVRMYRAGDLAQDVRDMATLLRGCARDPRPALCALFLVAPLLLRPLLPSISQDSLTYHLPYAREFAASGGIVTNLFLRYPFHALNYDLLFALGFLFSDDVMAHYLHAMAALVTSVGVYALGCRLANWVVGVLGMAAFLYAPLVVILLSTAYIDLGVTWFVFGAIYAVLLFSQDHDRRWVVVSAVLVGVAAGCKYLGLLYLVALGVWIAIESRSWRTVGLYFGVGMLVGSPWYIRSVLLCGNPLSPFAGKWFGYWPWTATDAKSQAWELSTHGVPRTLWNLARLPWMMWETPFKFHEGRFSLPYVVGLYGSLCFWAWKGLARRLALLVLVFTCLWFTGPHVKRYLLPVYPLLSAYMALMVWTLLLQPALHALSRGSAAKRVLAVVGTDARWATVLLAVVGGVALAVRAFPPDLPLTLDARRDYVSKRVCGYRAVEAINALPGKRVYQLGCPNPRFYCAKELVGDWFGDARYSGILEVRRSSAGIHEKLQSLGCDYVLLRLKEPFDLRADLAAEHFEPVYEDAEAAVYRVRWEGASAEVLL